MGLYKKIKHHPSEALKVIILWGFTLIFLYFATPSNRSFMAGLPFIFIGIFIRGWAAGHLQRNRQLATSGPYAYVRDPLYLGRFFLLCGFAVMANNRVTYILSAIGVMVFFLNYMPRKLRKENARLERHFGERYTEYHRYVRSLIPCLRPYGRRSKNRWRFVVFWRENREYWLIFTVILLTGLMAIKCWGI